MKNRAASVWVFVVLIAPFLPSAAFSHAAIVDSPTTDPLSISADVWFGFNVDVFYQVEKRLREGDTAPRRTLFQMVADGDPAQVVFAALLLLRTGQATVDDLDPWRLRVFDAMNRLWEGAEAASHPFRRELLYRMRHPKARPDRIPLAEKTYVEMLRADRVWGNAGWAVTFIKSCEEAFPGRGTDIFKAALHDTDRQARQLAFIEMTLREGVGKMAGFEPYIDAAIESLANDRIHWHMGYPNATVGTAVLFRIDPLPREKLVGVFSGRDPQSDLLAAAILSVRAPDAVTTPMIEFCASQMSRDEDYLNAEVAFAVLKNVGPHAHPALRRLVVSGDAQQTALAVIALADRKALPDDLDAERLLARLVDENGPVHTYAVPEAALVLARRVRSRVNTMAESATPASRGERFFEVLRNPASDRGDIEALFGPTSLAYRRELPTGHRLMEYLSPVGSESYVEFFKKIQKER